MGPFSWDAILARFRTVAGRLLPRSLVLQVLGRAMEFERAAMAEMGRALRAGRTTLAKWQAGMAAAISRSNIAAALIGAGGRHRGSPSVLAAAQAAIRKRLASLGQLAAKIAEGLPLDAKFMARIDKYARSYGEAFEAGARLADLEAGLDEECRIRNASHSCGDCVAYEELGWQPVGTLPLPREACTCGWNCKCVMVRRRSGGLPESEPPPLFRSAPAEIIMGPGAPDLADEILGPGWASKLAGLAGATRGSRVSVERSDGPSRRELRLSVSGPVLAAVRVLGLTGKGTGRGEPGRPFLALDGIEIRSGDRDRDGAIAAESFGRTVEAARAAGLKFLRLPARSAKHRGGSGADPMTAWPLLGFDAPLSESAKSSLSPKLGAWANRVSDLMRSQQGRRAWARLAAPGQLVFDLRPGSLSLAIWWTGLAAMGYSGEDDGSRSTAGPPGEPDRERPAFPAEAMQSAAGVWDGIGLDGPMAAEVGAEDRIEE